MRKLNVSTLVTLDGVTQDPGGFGETEQGGWAPEFFNDQAVEEAVAHLRASDYFLIGRRTYELLHKAWGGNSGNAYSDRMNEIPKLVVSNTLTGPLDWNATALGGDVAAKIARLKQETGGDIEVYGSATLVQTLIQHNLIDEYRVAVYPIVLGSGTRLFPDGGVPARLRLTGARMLDTGVAALTYVPAGT